MAKQKTQAQIEAEAKAIKEAQAKIAAAQAQIKSNETKLKAVTPTLQNFLASTNQAEAKDIKAPDYTPTYNAYADKYKNIRFGVVSAKDQESLANKEEKAFYVFDANSEAKKATDLDIQQANNQHQSYLDQQELLKKYIKSQNESVNNTTFDMYFQDTLKSKYSLLQSGYIDSDNPLFSQAAYNRAKYRTSQIVYGKDGRPLKSILSYKDTALANKTIESMRSLYMDTFNKDTNLQKQYATLYGKKLAAEQQTLQNQINALNKQLKLYAQ